MNKMNTANVIFKTGSSITLPNYAVEIDGVYGEVAGELMFFPIDEIECITPNA